MIKESQILYENGNYWILEIKPEVYQVMVRGQLVRLVIALTPISI